MENMNSAQNRRSKLAGLFPDAPGCESTVLITTTKPPNVNIKNDNNPLLLLLPEQIYAAAIHMHLDKLFTQK